MGSLRLEELPAPPPGKTGWPWTDAPQPLPETRPDGSPWPKISVVTPSYNQGQYIEETIRSVLMQCYPNLEYIVIDGGSTDNTLAVIEKYMRWLTYWVSEPDRGQGHAINKGIQKSSGDFIFWLNSDDLALPESFSTVGTCVSNNKNAKLITGQSYLIDFDRNIKGEVRSSFSSWEEIVTNPGNSVRQIATFFARDLFFEYGLINESLFVAMDNELMVRFTEHTQPIILENYLSAFRTHPYAKTASHLILGYTETDTARRKHLTVRSLIVQYRKRSAENWLSLYKMRKFSQTDRIKCLINAVKIFPQILKMRSFWSSVYNHSIKRNR